MSVHTRETRQVTGRQGMAELYVEQYLAGDGPTGQGEVIIQDEEWKGQLG